MPKSPEERTTELFSQNFDILARELQTRTVIIPGTGTSIVLAEVKPYPLSENKSWLYNPMQDMDAGDYWARYWPLRKMCLSLIVAIDEGKVGACVRVMKASRIDTERGVVVPVPKEGDIATYLSLRQNEISRLRFLDTTGTLYLIPTGRIVDKLQKVKGNNTEDADQALDRFFEEH